MKAKGITAVRLCMAAGLFAAGVSAADAKEPTSRAGRPNVIIILTDDQGYGDLSCHGNPVLKTPNLDRLHSESIRLTDFHVSPVCSPTRAALMTGRDPVRVGIWATVTDLSLMFAGEKTMADVFGANGYRTAMFGKWHLGDTPPYRPHDRGFQESLIEPGGVTGMLPAWWNNECWDDTFSRNGKPEKTKGPRTNVWFDEAVKWMDRCGSEGKPFFIYLATPEPHAPYLVSEEYCAPYRAADRAESRIKISGFYGMIAALDENIGRLDAHLAKRGLRDNTLLVFMTDNGTTAVGQLVNKAGMKGRKGEYYEGGHRVPCFVRWPAGGLTGGRDIGDLTVHKDWFPTLIDLCGLTPPSGLKLEGVSLKPLLMGKQDRLPERDVVVKWGTGHYNTAESLVKDKWNCAVLSGKWRLVNGGELYDIASDPGQSNDVAVKYPETVQKLRAVYEQYWSEVYPACFEKERPTLTGADSDPVMLTAAHWRAENEYGSRTFAHGFIRLGVPGQGSWSLDIERGGVYEFALQRWPKEADIPIRGIAPAVIQGHFITFLRGTRLPIASAKIRIGDEEKEVKVSDADKAAVFRLSLQTGNTRLRTAFLDNDGKELCGAYYVYVRRIGK